MKKKADTVPTPLNSQESHEIKEEGKATIEFDGLALVDGMLVWLDDKPSSFKKMMEKARENMALIKWPTPVQLSPPQVFIAELYFEPQCLYRPKAGQTSGMYSQPIYDSFVTIAENLVRDGFLTNTFDSKEILELAISPFNPGISLTSKARGEVAEFWEAHKSRRIDACMAEREAKRAAAMETRVREGAENARREKQRYARFAKRAATEEREAKRNAKLGKCSPLAVLRAARGREAVDRVTAHWKRVAADSVATVEKAQRETEEARAKAESIRAAAISTNTGLPDYAAGARISRSLKKAARDPGIVSQWKQAMRNKPTTYRTEAARKVGAKQEPKLSQRIVIVAVKEAGEWDRHSTECQ